jgi:hypothetical protein
MQWTCNEFGIFFFNKAGVFRDSMVCGDDIYLWEDDSGCNICL